MKTLQRLGWIVLGLVIILVFAPFLVPVPPVAPAYPASSLADVDSRFIQVNELNVHYKQYGLGNPAVILLHGFGASVFSWREVAVPLSKFGQVIAYDRPAFGLTSRPLPGEWSGISPYSPEYQINLVFDLMDRLGIQTAFLVGNSAGGTVALGAALERPERVKGLVLVDPAVSSNRGRGSLTRWLYQIPQINHIGPLLVRSLAGEQGDQTIRQAWHNPSKITPEIIAGYRKPLQAENWDRALWEFTRASASSGSQARLGELKVPVLVVTGDDDRIIPTQSTIYLAGEIPGAELVVFPACGHVPQEECPVEFIQAVGNFIQNQTKEE